MLLAWTVNSGGSTSSTSGYLCIGTLQSPPQSPPGVAARPGAAALPDVAAPHSKPSSHTCKPGSLHIHFQNWTGAGFRHRAQGLRLRAWIWDRRSRSQGSDSGLKLGFMAQRLNPGFVIVRLRASVEGCPGLESNVQGARCSAGAEGRGL